MNGLIYEIYLNDCVLIPGVTSGDPNSLSSQWFIPGSIIRGVAIHRALAGLSETKMRKDFFNSDLCFLHAYPAVGTTSERSLPTPISWRQVKDTEEELYNLAFSEQDFSEEDLEKVALPYCFIEDESNNDSVQYCNLVQVNDWFNLHIFRSTTNANDDSLMFRYQSIERDQLFIGFILSEDNELLNRIKSLFETNPELFIGKSHSAQYGHVTISLSNIVSKPSEYQEFGDDTNHISITLLSDTIIRNPETGASCNTLKPVMSIDHMKAFSDITIVGGYNRKWNLPLPQVQAIKAGSVFLYPYDDILLARVKKYAKTGIGERTKEGFGRIAINWINITDLAFRVQEESRSPIEEINLNSLAQSNKKLYMTAQLMVTRLFCDETDRILVAMINDVTITNPPTNTQLSRLSLVLRSILNSSKQKNAQEDMKEFFDSLKSNASDKFSTAKIGPKNLNRWIMGKVNEPENIWEDPLNVDMGNLPQVGMIYPDLTGLALNYTLRYIDGVIRMTMKKNSKSKGGNR